MEISIQTEPAWHDPLSSFLFDLGCTGVVSENFQDDTLKAYLPFQQDLEEIRNRINLYLQDLREIFPEALPPILKLSRVDDQDWGHNWRRFFRPVRVTPNLLIVPAWEPATNSADGHTIRIDPGPAFGTGQHATTQMCLAAMERVPLGGPWTMLDVGTGSGILAIYGIRIGAERVVAVDNDPEAIRWAGRNIRLNGITGSIRLSETPVEQLGERFSLVCANLILGEILRLLPAFSHLVNPGGWLILSGILREQMEEITRSLARNGLQEHETRYQDEWACIIATRAGRG